MIDRGKNPLVVFVDADNTLWDIDGVYAAAQLQLLGDVESAVSRSAVGNRLDFVRSIDQILAEQHHLGLRYPARYLVLATARVLSGRSLDRSVSSVWKVGGEEGAIESTKAAEIEVKFVTNLRRMPALLPGVQSGLQRLHTNSATVLVLSEGGRERVTRTAKALDLAKSIDRIIESPKQERLYHRVLRLAGSPDQAFMIGDQLLRDIAPANAAGLTTIYIPSRFKPRWEVSEDTVLPSFRVDNFDQAVDVVLNAHDAKATKAVGF